MTTALDRLLTETLRERADGARAPEELADRALAAARSRRSRRRSATILAVTATVAGMVIGATSLWRNGSPDPAGLTLATISSATGPAPSPELPVASRTPLDESAQSWNDELPVGPPVDVTPRLEAGLDRQVTLVTRNGRAGLGPDAGARYAILDPGPAHTLVTRSRVTSSTPSDWTVLDVADDGTMTEVAAGAAQGSVFEGVLVTGVARDPGGSGTYAISTEIDPNGAPDGPDILWLVRSGRAPTVRHDLGANSGRVLGWTSRGVLVNTSAGVQLWDPERDRLTAIYPHDDPLARVMPGDPDLVLVHREMDYGPDEDTIEPGGCLELIAVTTGKLRKLTCGDDPQGASRTPYPNAVNPDGTIVMAPLAMNVDGARVAEQGDPITSIANFGVFPQQRFTDSDHVIKPVGTPPGWWQWWVRCDVRKQACEQAPLPAGIRAISLY